MGGGAGSLEDGGVAERLGTDLRYVTPPYIGPPLPKLRRRLVDEPLGHPPPADGQRIRRICRAGRMALRGVDDGRGGRAVGPGPAPIGSTTPHCRRCVRRYPDLAIAAGGTHVQDFINGVAFGRGVEQVLLDIAAGRSRLSVHRRAAAPLLHGLHRADAGGRRRANRPGPLRRRFRQPARAADLAGQLRPALRRAEEGAFRPGPQLRRQGVAPLLRVEPGPDSAVHPVRHGLAANHPAAGRRHESVRAETRVRRPNRPARGGRRARLAATLDAARKSRPK